MFCKKLLFPKKFLESFAAGTKLRHLPLFTMAEIQIQIVISAFDVKIIQQFTKLSERFHKILLFVFFFLHFWLFLFSFLRFFSSSFSFYMPLAIFSLYLIHARFILHLWFTRSLNKDWSLRFIARRNSTRGKRSLHREIFQLFCLCLFSCFSIKKYQIFCISCWWSQTLILWSKAIVIRKENKHKTQTIGRHRRWKIQKEPFLLLHFFDL